MFPNCLYRCPGNRCGTIDSIESGDQEPEQIELLNMRNSIIETEHEQGSYKGEEIEEDKSNDEHKQFVCTNCDNALGSYGCIDCKDIFCDECYKTHSKLKKNRDHDVLTIQELFN